MATYYWVGGSGTWDTSTTTNWASSTGGSGGAGVPTSADNVIFDSLSGAAPTVTVTAAVCSACTVGAPTSGTLTFAFGASTLTAGGNITFTTTVSITGTGTIIQSAASPTFAGNGNTFYNLTFSSLANVSVSITGANTFNNLSFATKTGVGVGFVSFSANQVINGTLTTGSTDATTRYYFASSVLGTPITITAASVSLSDTDFRDITGAGTATWTGTRLGNGLGNSNITFATPKNVYWNLAGSQSIQAVAWAPSSGGTPAVNNFPLMQDTAVFDNAGSVGTVTLSANWYLGTIDMSLRTSAMTLAVNAASQIYGSWKNGTGTTISGAAGISFYNRSTQTITSNNVAFTQAITLSAFGGALQLIDTLTLPTTLAFTLSYGTLNLNNQTLSAGILGGSGANTRSITFGTNPILVTGSGVRVVDMSNISNFTYTGTPAINLTYSGSTGTRSISHGTANASESNVLNFAVTAGTDIFVFNSGSNVKNIDFTGFSGTFNNVTLTVYGNFTMSSGATVASGTSTVTLAATSGTKTITTATKTFDFPLTFSGLGGTFAFQDALTQGSTRAFTITNGTVQLKASATSTVGSFVTTGTTLKYLQSTTPGTQATISDASGTDSVTYLYIQDSNATGGATWDATSTTNSNYGNNTGWLFSASAPLYSGMLPSFGLGFRI
jgi:hypothetical protein